MTGAIRRVPLVGQDLMIIYHSVFSGVRVAWSLVFCVLFCRSMFVLLFVFGLAIVLFVLLRFMNSDYPIGIFNLTLPITKTNANINMDSTIAGTLCITIILRMPVDWILMQYLIATFSLSNVAP